MSSRWELDDGIESIKSAWQREHTARGILEKMLENVCAENAKLRELCEDCAIELYANGNVTDAATENLFDDMRKLGIEVGKYA